MQKSIGTILQSVYRKVRVPLAFGLVLAAFGLKWTPWPQATEATLLTLGLLLLPLFFEMHRAVTTSKPPAVFRSFSEAGSEINQAVEEYLRRSKSPSIRCLGVALFYQWPFLEDLLGRLLDESRTRLSIDIAMLDPSWAEMDRFNDAWPAQAQGSYTRLQSFLEQNRERFADLTWTMNVRVYRSLPLWYGILLGEDTLFLGTTYWHNDKLKAGQNTVEMFKWAEVPRGPARIQEFIGWFNYSKARRFDLSVVPVSALTPERAPAADPPS